MHTNTLPKGYHNYGTIDNPIDRMTFNAILYSKRCLDILFSKPHLLIKTRAETAIFIYYNLLKCIYKDINRAKATIIRIAKALPEPLSKDIVEKAIKNANSHIAIDGFIRYGNGIFTYSPANIPKKLGLSEEDAKECGFYASHYSKAKSRQMADNNKKSSEDTLHYIATLIMEGCKRSQIIKDVIANYKWSKSTAYNYYNKVIEKGVDNIRETDEIWPSRYKHQKIPKTPYPINTIDYSINYSDTQYDSYINGNETKLTAETYYDSTTIIHSDSLGDALLPVNSHSEKEKKETDSSIYSLTNRSNLIAQCCLNDLKNGKDVIITGGAGVGKSFFIKKYLSKCKKRFLTLVPTNQLRSTYTAFKAYTIHSTLKMLPEPYSINAEVTKKTLNAIRGYDVIFIDEVGYIRTDVMNYVLKAIRIIEQQEEKHIQVILTGDYGQLSPVVTDEDIPIMSEYSGIYSCDAPEFNMRNWETHVFKENHRLKGADELTKRFIHEIERIRLGISEGINWLNSVLSHDEDKTGIYACTRNEDVERINTWYAAHFKNGRQYYNGKNIRLSVGMRVMTTANTKSYYNGKQGYIVELRNESVKIQFNDEKKPITVRYTEINNERILPVVIAKAITIHKLQGSTLEVVNIVCGKGFFADGQLYSALTRCSDVRKINLIGFLKKSDVKANLELISRIESSSYALI